jgi:hypothetical protein
MFGHPKQTYMKKSAFSQVTFGFAIGVMPSKPVREKQQTSTLYHGSIQTNLLK